MAFFDSSKSRLHLGATDFSPYATEVSGLPGERPLNDVTTLLDSGMKHLPTVQVATPSISGLWDPAALAQDAEAGVLRTGSSLTLPVSYWPGGIGVGDYGYGARVLAHDYQVQSRVGEVVAFELPLSAHGAAARIRSLAPAKTVEAASRNVASVDDAAGSSAGGAFFVHVFAVSATGGNAQWLVDLEDSTDDISFATFASAIFGDAATGGFWIETAGTFNRYVRVALTLDASSGSITWHAGHERR